MEKVVPVTGTRRRLVRFLFSPPPLGPKPSAWVVFELAGVAVFNRFAARLAKSPPDLVTHLGMDRSNAYFAAGCPVELCDHAAARDLWRAIYQDSIEEGLHAAALGPVAEAGTAQLARTLWDSRWWRPLPGHARTGLFARIDLNLWDTRFSYHPPNHQILKLILSLER